MNYKHILAIDPSGSYYEGKGTTGWAFIKTTKHGLEIIDAGWISATKYSTPESYWEAHVNLIRNCKKHHNKLAVVIEDYILYADKATAQINSKMETSKLIGILSYACKQTLNLPVYTQLAAEVKSRWTNDILAYKHYIIKKGNRYKTTNNMDLNKHSLDAIRHGVHFATFKNRR